MATASDGIDSALAAGPISTMGFGPRESADETRQAQQQVANDAPVDVNPNAVTAREQTGTLVLMGKNFEAGAARRNGIFDLMSAKIVPVG